MPNIVCYFQMHQPHRLRRYSVFDTSHAYFDDGLNATICKRVAERCYRPALGVLGRLIDRHAGRFGFALAITGTLIDQLEAHAPDVLVTIRELAATGRCELIAETDPHALSALGPIELFHEHVETHLARLRAHFGFEARVFRNTELIYSNALARELSAWRTPDGSPRFVACLAEGVGRVLAGRTPNAVYRAPESDGGVRLLLRNHRLSDDVAFRFGDRTWAHWPLGAETYAGWLDALDAGSGEPRVCNLFMDFETFGEHHQRESGILDFLETFPARLLERAERHRFVTPSEAVGLGPDGGVYDCPSWTSWADTSRDLGAWQGNAMQVAALSRLHELGLRVRERLMQQATPALRDIGADWRRLASSDHVYYAATANRADGAVHSYFSPYDSPYDAYINMMNVLDDLEERFSTTI